MYVQAVLVARPVPVDSTGSGTAIGTSDGVGLPANAFDNNTGTNFRSQHVDTGISGVDYIGYDFGSGVFLNIRTMTIKQGGSDSKNQQSSVKSQYSDNGSSWTDAGTHSINQDTSVQSIAIPHSGPHRYWRLLANSTPSTSGSWLWFVVEVEMLEA